MEKQQGRGTVAGHHYEIVVFGAAGAGVQAAFDEFEVDVGNSCTRLRTLFVDQAALFGALDRVRNLGLELVEVRRLD